MRQSHGSSDRGAMCDTVPMPPVGAVTITSDENNRGRWLEFSQADLIEAELAQGQAIADTFAEASTTTETTARRWCHVHLGADASRSRECRRKRPTPPRRLADRDRPVGRGDPATRAP
jgi:hypothetical protein